MRLRNLTILVFIAGLQGCANLPKSIGMSQANWDALAQPEREAILAHFHAIEDMNPVSTGPVNQHRHRLQLDLLEGSAHMWPYEEGVTYPFMPIQLALNEGTCRKPNLVAEDGEHQTSLLACYYGGVLYLDPSHMDVDESRGTALFYNTPLWNRGVTYFPVNTERGFTGLRQARLHVQRLQPVQPA